MALETATHINDLVTTNPDGLDDVSQGDNHIRMVKDVLKRDLPLTQPATALGMSLLTSATSAAIRALLGASNNPFRNRIINGAMSVYQRTGGAGQTITAGAALLYTVDRFYAYCTGANLVSTQSTLTGGRFNMQLSATTSGNTGAGFGTRLLAKNTLDLAGQNVTLSALLSSNGATSVTWSVFYANTTDSFGTLAAPTRTTISSGTFSVTGTETLFSTIIAIPSAATTGIEIVFTVPAIPVLTVVTFSNIQLEKGSIATSDIVFEVVDDSLDILRCQRYYLRTTCTARAYASIADQNIDAPIYFPAQMRATPTATFITGTGTVANVSSESVVGITNQSARFSIQSTSTGDSLAVDRAYSFSAEL